MGVFAAFLMISSLMAAPLSAADNHPGTGTDSIQIGDGAEALGDLAIAIGKDAKAKAARTVVIGSDSTVENDDSMAISNGNYIKYRNSLAFGRNNSLEVLGETVIGTGNVMRASPNSFIMGLENNVLSGASLILLGEKTTSAKKSTPLKLLYGGITVHLSMI